MRKARDLLAIPIIVAALAAAAPALGQGGADQNAAAGAAGDVLRFCADPNNLPFSDEKRQGFENKLADLVARDLGRTVAYTWWAQRRGFVRKTLKEGQCDLVMGVPAHYDLVETTKPYYRSTYVFVSRADRGLGISSLKDQRLRDMSIGVHLIGKTRPTPRPRMRSAPKG
jgi:ABC-type amino acid transport substrate-binding protein